MFERKGELNFVLIGAKSTGKTQYIKHLNNRLEISAETNETVAYIESLKEDKATSISLTELFFNYKDDTYTIDFQIDDYDGNFVETWHTDENSDYKEKLTEYIKESEGIFLFLPYETIDTDTKFNSMKRETDTFINKIKEEYGEEHAQLPIPVVICVTKWDENENFKNDNENQHAVNYIEENEALKLIKDKVSLHFKHVKIIPMSSQKDHNITLPIRLCLDDTYQSWEDKISTLQDDNQKEELMIYLSDILYDLRFYKNGIYKTMYQDVEAQVSLSYLEEIRNIENINKFNTYFEANEELLVSLSLEHQEIIEKKRKSLITKHTIKKVLISACIVTFIVAGGFYFDKYTKEQAELKQYNNIKTEKSNENYSAVMLSVQKYYKNHDGINKQHNAEVKEIEENTKSTFRKQIEEKIALFPNLTSIVAKFDMMSDIYVSYKSYGLEESEEAAIVERYREIKELKDTYDSVFEDISRLSFENIEQNKIENIKTKLNILAIYDESKRQQKIFDEKINGIVVLALDSKEEKVIDKMIDLSTSINISEARMLVFKERKAYIMLRNEYKEFKDALVNNTINENVTYINSNWNTLWDDNDKNEIVQLINAKYNTFVKEKLNYSAAEIVSYSNMEKILSSDKKINSLYDSLKSSQFKLNLSMNEANKIESDKQIDEYNKYSNMLNNGVAITSFTFFAPTGNPLGFSCQDKDIEIYIDGQYWYNSNHGGECSDNTVTYSRAIQYYAKAYNVYLKEKNMFADGTASGIFEITKNDLIKLYNTQSVEYKLNGGYSITLQR